MTTKQTSKRRPPVNAQALTTALPDEAFDRTPRVTLTLTRETIYLTRHDERGAPISTYPVSAKDVAGVFNNYGADSGLVPENILFWQSKGKQLRVGIWLPPAKRSLRLAAGRKAIKVTIPLPGFVFVGCGTEYSIYAAPARPAKPADALCHAPLPNVYPGGNICTGSVRMPVCSVETVSQAAALFFESEFSDHLIEGKLTGGQPLMQFLRALDRKRAFPMKQLAPNALTIADVLKGETSHARTYQQRERRPQTDIAWGNWGTAEAAPARVIDPFYGPLDGTDGTDDEMGGDDE